MAGKKSGVSNEFDWSRIPTSKEENEKYKKDAGTSSGSSASGQGQTYYYANKSKEEEFDWSRIPTNEQESKKYQQSMVRTAAEVQSDRQKLLRQQREDYLAYAEQRYKERAAAREAGAAAQQTAQTPGFLAPKNSFTMPGAAAATLGFQQQTQNKMPYQTRSFLDRDSVVQGKVYEGAAAGMQQAEAEGDIYGYIQHLDAAQKAYGNLAQNQKEQWKKEAPAEYYAYTMSADSINKAIERAKEEIAAAERGKEEAAKAQARMEGRYGYDDYDEAKLQKLWMDQYDAGKRIEQLTADLAYYQGALQLQDYQQYNQLREEYSPSGSMSPEEWRRRLAEGVKKYKAKKEAYNQAASLSNAGYASMAPSYQTDLMLGSAHDQERKQRQENIADAWEQLAEDVENGWHLNKNDLDVFFVLYAEDPEKAEWFAHQAKLQRDDEYQKQIAELSKGNPLRRIYGMQAGVIGRIMGGAVNLVAPYSETALELNRMGNALVGGAAEDVKEKGLLNTGFMAGEISEGHGILSGKSLADVYQLGSSMLESGIFAVAASAAGNYGAAAAKVVEFLGTVIMGSSAAASDYDECIKRGLTRQQAMAHATASGIAEAAFEYISLDKLVSQESKLGLDAGLKDHIKEAIGNFFVQGGVEASEEFCTTVANRVSDYVLARAQGYDTKIEERERELIRMGLGVQAAKKKAEQEWLTECINDAIGGFISGGTMSGAKSTMEIVDNWQKIRANDAARKARTAGDGDLISGGSRDVIRTDPSTAASGGPPPLQAGEIQTGETDSSAPRDGRPVPYGAQNDSEGTRGVYEQTKAETAEQARKLSDEELAVMVENVEQNLEETGPTAPATEVAVMEGQRDALRQEISAREAVERNGKRMERAAQAAEVPGPEWNDGSREYQATGNRKQATEDVGREGRPMTASTGTEERIATAPAAPRNDEIEGGLNYGAGTESAADRGQRDAGLGAGEQAGGLGEGAGGQVTRSGGTSELRQLRDYVKALGAERASARDLGIQNGTKNASNVLIDVEALTGSMKDRLTALREKAGQDGVRLDFVVGQMETRHGGRTVKSSGVYQVDADGTPHVFIQADSMRHSAEQLYEHEMFHAIVSRNKGLWQDIVRHLYETRSREEIRAMVDAYASAYAGCYDNEADAVELYLEEILADVYAEMQRGGGQQSAARELARETAQRFAGDIENARQNRAGIDRTNGPGTRLSAEEKQDQRHILTKLSDAISSLSDMKPVAAVSETAFAKDPNMQLSEQVDNYFDKLGGKVERPGFGDVLLKYRRGKLKAGVSSDIAHGIGRAKAATFEAVPQVIKEGRQIDFQENWKGKGFDSYAFAAPVTIGDQTAYMTVVVLHDKSVNAFYLHEVLDENGNFVIISQTKEDDASPLHSRPAEAGGDESSSNQSIAQAPENSKGLGEKKSQATNNEIDWVGSREEPETRMSTADKGDGGVDWLNRSDLETTPRGEGSNRWSDLRSRVSELSESQRKSLVAEAAELNNATWREEGLGIKPYSGDLADTEAVLRYVDDAVAAVKSEPGAAEYDPSFDLEALPRNEGSGLRFSAADEEDDRGVDWLDGSELEDETPPHPSPAATPSPQGEGSGGQIARATETEERIAAAPEAPRNDKTGSAARTDVPSSVTAEAVTPSPQGEDFAALARDKKVEMAGKLGVDGLKSRIKSAEERLKMWKAMQSSGLVAKDANSVQELKNRIADTQETLNIFREELAKKQDAKKAAAADKELRAARKAERAAERKAAAKAAELADNTPRQARREFREDALNLFSVQAGKRQTLGNIINSFADKLIAQGSVSEADRAELFRQLYEAGVEVIPADEYHRNIREAVDSARIYVPDSVRAEFGDDWNDFRQKAWGNGVYLTNSQSDRGADFWNAELAEMFPGSFDAGETDARIMLENIVDLAEEGKAEFVSLPEMMRRNQAETGVTVDQQMDELERKVDHMIDTFAQKARIEAKTAKRGMMQLVRERQYNREQVERQAQRRREIETRNEVMKQIQKLQRMRKRVSPDFQGQIDELIGRLDPDGSVGIKGMYGVIDAQARSISAKGLEDLPALVRQYEEYKKAKGEDFLPNAAVEKRINRLKEIQLDSLTLDDVITLGEAVSGLVTQIQNENKLLADERHGEISASAGKIDTEVKNSKGKMIGEAFWAGEMLDMPRYLQHLTGWKRGGEGERFAKLLEKATEDESAYISGADALFDEFKKNKENRDWLKKATGRHAESIEIKVPVDIGKDANGNTVVEWQTFEITPMMRVALLMHSRNYENLRHIAETGIQIPKLDDFRKGKMKAALSGVDPVRMAPSTVKAIVKECTAQERAFADVLAAYFDVYAKERINNVSLVLDGFYRANVEHYFPIDSARDYLGGGNDYVAFDRSLESIGSLKERKNGINPIVLGDALDSASRHMATFARYTAFAIPMRDFNEVFSYVFHEEGKPFAGSVMHTIGKQFGPSAPDSIKQIQAALAQQNPTSDEVFMKTLRKIRGRIASASLSGNVRVMASQFASLPYALPYLGAQDLLASFVNPVDTKVRDIYSPISQFRRGGYITQELGDLKSEHPLLNSIPVVMTGITDVDTFTINRLWSAAVNKVYRTTDLKPGSREQVLSGNDDFYKAVAEIYTEAVYKTQPNYTTVQRPALLRDSNDLVRSLFMYKTVPFQVYGMLYEATGRLANDQARYNANKSTENKENLQASRKFYAKTQAAVFIGSTLYVAIRALIGGGLFREKKYRDDEEGKMTLESVAKALGRDLIDTYAGSFVGASELLAIIDKATGNSSYNNKIFNDISSLGEIEKAANVLINSYKAITEKDWRQGKKAIKDAAQEISVLGFGFPAKNIEKFLLSTTKWIAPEWADRYENYFDEYERGDLDEESERFFKASLRVLMDNRTDGLKDETIDELTRLWTSDQTAQIPSAIQTSISINGEDVKLTAAQRETYRELWSEVVSEYLEPLMASDAYEAADDKGKARLISQLYEYARQQAAAKVAGSEPDPWVLFGQTCEEAGIPLNEYLAVRSTTRKDLQDMDGEALDSAIRGQMEFRVGELDEKNLDELAQLFANGGVNALPPDVPDDVSVDGETVKFSQEERVVWLQSFKRTAGESLEALMASKTYAEADEEGKVKLISGLYEVARAAASMELAPGYSPHKWITTGLEAAEQGVPLDEYVAFHYLTNAESKDKEQIQILMNQDWTDSQKETVWTGWLADEGQMRKYENLKNGGASWTDAMGVMDIGGDATEGLTEAQAAVYQQKWDSITGKATKALMQTKAYKDANNEGKEAFVDKLNTYASAVARAEALKTTPKDSWVTAGMAAEKEGVSLEKYIVFTVQLGKLNGKDEKGETVDGLLNQRSLDLLNKTGWTDKQKETVYLKSGMTDDSKEEKVKALREAGLTWEQTSSVMRSLGKEAEHARAITATNATEDVKLKALEVYLTESQYKSAKACRAYNIKLDTWLQAKVDADANSNDRVTQEEAEDYIDGLNIGWEEKAYLWQLLCPSQKNASGKYPDTWKKNPYSTTLGREVWEYIYGN